MTKEIKTSSPQETFEFGYHFSEHLYPPTVVTFYGELASGKTTCIRGICRGLGVTEPITSPTFTLINEYQGSVPVFHFDFYRVKDSRELMHLGLDEYFEKNAVCLIEWPKVAATRLPEHHWEMRLAWDFSVDHSQSRSIKWTQR